MDLKLCRFKVPFSSPTLDLHHEDILFPINPKFSEKCIENGKWKMHNTRIIKLPMV
jgi:hypothetical protein